MRKAMAIALTALSIATVGATVAQAAAGEVRVKGACSGTSEWELRITPRGDTFRVRWDVDSGVVGQSWQMSLDHNGTQIASGTRVTNANAEAEFRLRGVPNLAGTDTFTGHATNPATGETCTGTASI